MIELILWCFLLALLPWAFGIAWMLTSVVRARFGPGVARDLAGPRRMDPRHYVPRPLMAPLREPPSRRAW